MNLLTHLCARKSSTFITFLYGTHIISLGCDGLSLTEKMDVLDLIIETLKAHEKTLDELAFRLENGLNAKSPLRAPQNENELESWR